MIADQTAVAHRDTSALKADGFAATRLAGALRGAVAGGVFLVPLVPLVVTPWLYFPYVTGKAFAFRVLMEALFGLWVLWLILDPDRRPRLLGREARGSPVAVAGAAFVAVLVVTTAVSQDPHRSFWSNLERMEGLVTHLHLVGYFVVLGSVLNKEKSWFGYANLSIAVSVVVGVLAVMRGGDRLYGTLGGAPFLATYMLTHALVTTWLWLRTRRASPFAHLYVPIAAFQVGILYATATRGALIALVGGVGACVFAASLRHGARAATRTLALLLVAAASLVGAFWLLRDTSLVRDSYVLFRFAKMLPNSRTTIWEIGLAGARERPLLGWGMESFPLVFSQHYDPALGAPGEWIDRVHNTPLEWMVSAGGLGALGYLGLFAASLYCTWRRAPSFGVLDRSMLTGLLAAILVNALFVFDTLVSYLFLVALLAYVHSRCRPTPAVAAPDRPSTAALAAAMVAVSVATVGTIYAVNWRPYRAAEELALAASPGIGAAEQLEHFENVFALRTFASSEAAERIASITVATVLPSPGISDATQEQFLELARREIVYQADDHAADARYPYFAGRFLTGVGEPGAAVAYLERALDVSPRMPMIWLALADARLRSGRTAQALEAAEHGFELNPEVDESRAVYAQMAVHSGDLALAASLLQERARVKPAILLDDRLVMAYHEVERPQALIELWMEHAAVRPVFREKMTRYLEELRVQARRQEPRVDVPD